ncbi:hypothetical protein [Streptomyces sp. DSM 15324]|uniref:hypothetical protein n=1 Tax=Streptomyces sp. DSM 15324 TaxID=1739111 RepID=UPI00074B1CBC|nr:hypothetical protein [Streptomyces sp. DSM 15324]KUO09808.1 hypothetical protein AQJ58_22405 [Streptomyces sp. DSM 15324]
MPIQLSATSVRPQDQGRPCSRADRRDERVQYRQGPAGRRRQAPRHAPEWSWRRRRTCAWPDRSRARTTGPPDNTDRAQHKARVHSHQSLRGEGLNKVLAENLYRLEPFLRRLSETRDTDLGLDGSDGLG